jgi:hypothetical protein
MQVNFECMNKHFFSAFFQPSSTFFSQETNATTEIELNGLLKRFVVRQAKRRDGSRSPDPQPTRSAQHRSWQPALWLVSGLAAMPDYFSSVFRS